MPTFLDNLTEYNAKASLAISQAVADGNLPKANMMSSLKSTANDTTLTDAVRLNALTALINLGSLLTIPLPPYFPVVTTFPDTQVYVGLHNELSGLQGGQAGEFYHLTQAQWTALGSAASAADISFENLQGFYTDNASLVGGFNSKQDALSGNGFVKISGTTISYDNSVYLTSSTGIASGASFGGEVSGTYSNLTLVNNAVIGKVLTGWNGSAAYSAITSSDTILSGMEKLNARISDIISNPAGVASVVASTNAPSVISISPTTVATGAVSVSVNLQSQTQNKFLASPDGNTGVPSFRAIAVDDLPASAVTPAQYGSSTLIPQVTVDAKGRITAIATVASASGGQVNSVTFSGPGGVFLDSNTGTATDPIVGFTLDDVSANYVWAGPSSGPVGQPAFRALVLDDIAGITIPQSQIDGLTETLSTFLTGSLANSTMYVGNGSGAAVAGTVSGDLSMVYVLNNGADEASFTIEDGVVTYDKIQDVTSETILGRYSAIDGPPQQLTLDPSAFTLNNTTGVIGLQTPNPSLLTQKGDLLTRNASAPVRLIIGANATIFMADNAAPTGNKWVAMSGDVSIATSGATTIANNAVTFAKMQTIADGRILGNNSGNTDIPSDLTGTEVTALLDIFTATDKGLVPSATNTAYFLRGDGTWQPGTGGATTFPLTMDNSGSGAASGTTFDGSAARTISYNTIGAPSVTGTNASGLWPISITGNAGNVSGTVAIANGGTGANAPQGAINNLVGVQSSGQYLRSNGTNVSMSSLAAADLTGSVAVANGGTGQTTYTDGQLLIGNSAGTLTKSTLTPGTGISITNGNGSITIGLVGGGSSVTTFSGGTTGLTPNTPTSGPVVLAGTLNVANGGTGLTSGNSGGILYYSASGTLASTATLGQYELIIGGGAGNPPVSLNNGATGSILTSNSTSSSPSWTAATYPSTTTAKSILYSSATNTVSEIVAPITANTFLKWDGTTFTWDTAGSGSGTVNPGTTNQVAYYTGSTAVSSTTVSPTNGTFLLTQVVTAGTAAVPTWTGSTGTTLVVLQDTPSIFSPVIGNTASNGHMHLRRAGTLPAGYGNNYATLGFLNSTKTLSIRFDLDGFESEFLFQAATATKTYTFPNLSGTVTLLGNSVTGSGSIVLDNTPTLITPNIGAATATSINKVTITAPATSATLTLANGSTLATSGAFSTTFAAGATTTLTLPLVSGTLATLAGSETLTNKTLTSPVINVGSDATGDIYYRNSGGLFTRLPIGSTNQYLQVVGGIPSWQTLSGSGILSLNALTTATQTFATGTSGTDFNISSVTSTHTFNIPDASTTARGLVTTGTQTFAGSKTIQTAGDPATAQLSITNSGGSAIQWMGFPTGASNFAAPAAIGAGGATRSLGTKLVLYPGSTTTSSDIALGVESGAMWLSATSGGTTSIKFYVQSGSTFGNTSISTVAQIENSTSVYGINIPTAGSATVSNLLFSNAGGQNSYQYIQFGTVAGGTGYNPPVSNALTARSSGTKIVLAPATLANFYDYAIGVNAGVAWFSSIISFEFYSNNGTPSTSNKVMTMAGDGTITIINSIVGAASQNVFNTVSTTVNFAGAATTLTIGNTATAAQTVNMFTASTGASTYNFATGATANATTKTINIGTAGVSGSTTAINIGSAVSGATNTIAIRGNLTLGTSGGNMGFWGTAAVARQTITNDTLANLYTALRAYGLIL